MAAAIRTTFVAAFAQSAAAGIGATFVVDLTLARPVDLIDCRVLPVATAGVSGAVRIQRQALGSGAFSDAITAAGGGAITATTSGTLARAGAIVVAQRSCVATDVLRYQMVDGGGAGGANAIAYVTLLATPITGQ